MDEGPAFSWLVSTCAGYMSVCALGLQYGVGEKIKEIVTRFAIVLDTDMVLNLLCEGEVLHTAVSELHRHWRRLGGSLFCARPVLEEVAYHAHIANTDYQYSQPWRMLDEMERYVSIRNAFVRWFAKLLHEDKVRPREWMGFINDFRGNAPYDSERILHAISSDHLVEILPEPSPRFETLRIDIRDHIRLKVASRDTQFDKRGEKILRDKADRDARLLASIAERREILRRGQGTRACVLVSSSRLLRDASVKMKLGDDAVVGLDKITFLLTLVPGVSISLNSLKSLLFDKHFRQNVGSIYDKMLALIQNSGNFKFPWAKRSVLAKRLSSNILSVANDLDKSPSDVMDTLFSGEDLEETLGAFLKALDETGADHRLVIENEKLRERVRQLEEERQK